METGEFTILLIAILAFFIGIVAHKFIAKETHNLRYLKREVSLLEHLLLLLVVPFFFIAMGLHFSIQDLTLNILPFVLIVMIAISGKIFGTLLTKPFTTISLKQLYLVGWGMNSRGAVELAIAFVAFKIGLFETEIYSSLVAMALITTLIFPFFVKGIIKKNPNIME